MGPLDPPFERRRSRRTQIEGEVGKRLARLAKTVKVPGFRPGHVPMKMVAQQYGPQVRSDVISDAVQKSFNDAVREQNLRVAGNPRIEPAAERDRTTARSSSPRCSRSIPSSRSATSSGGTIERPQVEVTDADIDRTLEVLRKQRATWHDGDRWRATGDRVKVDFTGTIDGVAFAGGQAQDFDDHARRRPHAARVRDRGRRHEGGRGPRPFRSRFPPTTTARKSPGSSAQFALTVKSVERPDVPAARQRVRHDVRHQVGQGRGPARRGRVQPALELKRKVESNLRDQAMKVLREKTQFALPDSLVEMETHELMRRMSANLQQQGMKAEDIKLSPEMFRPQAEDRVALGLIVSELVRSTTSRPRPSR